VLQHLLIKPLTAKNDRARTVNPFGIGAMFLGYCLEKGRLMQEDKGKNAKYYVTEEGKKDIARSGISLSERDREKEGTWA
jgi:hypothetical protein